MFRIYHRGYAYGSTPAFLLPIPNGINATVIKATQ